MYKLLALDLDDTLLDSNIVIPENSRRAVDLARQSGVRVTFATGRTFRSALPFAQELAIEDYIMTYQGALVKHSVNGQVLSRLPLPFDVALKVIDLVDSYGYHLNVYLDDTPYIAKPSEESKRYNAISKIPMIEVGDLGSFLRQKGEAPIKILAVAEEELLDRLADEAKLIFAKQLHICKSKPTFLEFSHLLGNKGDGLATIAAHYGIAREEIIAVGDSYNDLEMIEYAGLGVVVSNARQEIKDRADYVCPSNDECGIAEVVEKFILHL